MFFIINHKKITIMFPECYMNMNISLRYSITGPLYKGRCLLATSIRCMGSMDPGCKMLASDSNFISI